MEDEVKYEYKVERIRKRKKTKLEKSIIVIGILFFIILFIYSNLASLTPSKQDDFMEVAKEIEKYIEYNYMNCRHSNDDNRDYDEDIINEDCSLKDNYFSKVIANSGYSEKDIKEVIVNFNSRKMRIIATDDGFYAGTTIIELDLHID